MARGAGQDEPGEVPARNEVLLVGRVAASAQERELPSGDLLVSFRLVVDRPTAPRRRTEGRAIGVDTFDCAAWGAGVRRTARAFGPGDVVEVQGSLRRRFWRSGDGAASRTEVEVSALRRLVRAAPGARTSRRSASGPASAPAPGPESAAPVATDVPA